MNMTPYMFMYNTTIKSLCLTLSWRMARSPLTSKDQHVAEQFVRQYANNIIDKWTNYFIKKKRVVCTTIKKRLK